MFAPIKVKRAIKRLAGWSSVCIDQINHAPQKNSTCVFYYHRIADLGFYDSEIDDRNVSPALFEKQLEALVDFADVVPISEIFNRMQNRKENGSRPLVSLTFDDGYANFYTNVVPVLKRYGAHATLFVVTGEIAGDAPANFDHWARKNVNRVGTKSWRILNWKEIDRCVASGAVTLGGHSHRHFKATECTPDQLMDEAGICAEILRRRFGREHAIAYAYPYGNSQLNHVSDAYERAVRAAGFELAVTTCVGLTHPLSNRFRIPRLEANCTDSARTLRAKTNGSLTPYSIFDTLREFRNQTFSIFRKSIPAGLNSRDHHIAK